MRRYTGFCCTLVTERAFFATCDDGPYSCTSAHSFRVKLLILDTKAWPPVQNRARHKSLAHPDWRGGCWELSNSPADSQTGGMPAQSMMKSPILMKSAAQETKACKL